MDWSKAKTILIVAFLITNIILAFFVVHSRRSLEPSLTDDFIGEVVARLDSKDIKLSTEIPREELGLVPLTVSYEALDPQLINTRLYGGQAQLEEMENRLVLRDGLSESSIENGKLFKYEAYQGQANYKELDREQALDLAGDFIRRLGFDRDDLVQSYLLKIGDKYLVSYSKKYEGVYVEKAYIDILVGSQGVERAERLWLDIRARGDAKIYTSRAPKSLLKLLSRDSVYGKEIVDISICYFFDPGQHEYIETVENAKEGKTLPGWRILFSDGSRLILDNYN